MFFRSVSRHVVYVVQQRTYYNTLCSCCHNKSEKWLWGAILQHFFHPPPPVTTIIPLNIWFFSCWAKSIIITTIVLDEYRASGFLLGLLWCAKLKATSPRTITSPNWIPCGSGRSLCRGYQCCGGGRQQEKNVTSLSSTSWSWLPGWLGMSPLSGRAVRKAQAQHHVQQCRVTSTRIVCTVNRNSNFQLH